MGIGEAGGGTYQDVAVVVVAAGRGHRAGEGLPKQYRALGGAPVLARTLRALVAALPGARIAPVIHPADRALFAAALICSTAALNPACQIGILGSFPVCPIASRSDPYRYRSAW
ncbi:MAG: 2-C-methyl-D-erythritol 4-phosphate cytidylyltransferase, partial [Beijerinckiaceae bacterium]